MKQRFTVKNRSKGSRNFEQYNTAVKRNETRVALVMMVKVIKICQRYILLFKPELHRLVEITQNPLKAYILLLRTK